MAGVEHIAARTWHGRTGTVANAFAYGIDYVLLDAEAAAEGPFFRRNRAGLLSIRDRDHGGPPGAGRGPAWAREVLRDHGLASATAGPLQLLAQPRVLGHVFNPVSFWLAHDRAGTLRAVIAEVSNTFGDRHSYLCCHEDCAPIGPRDVMRARKVFHVSPFRRIEGAYSFRFDIGPDRMAIRIGHETGPNEGFAATLTGAREPLTRRGAMRALVRRPLGARRVLALIHWQAAKLWWKGARYARRPAPPASDVSR